MRTLAFSLLVLGTALSWPAAAAPPAGWEAWVPESATAVLSINANALNASPLALRGKWGTRHASGMPVDITSLPDATTSILTASDLSPRTLDGTWRVAVIDVKRPVTAADLAAREGGRVDTIREHQVVVTPRNMVLVPVGGTRIAGRIPADRQAISRWLSSGKGRAAGPSAYLKAAVDGTRAPVVAAIDLTDAIDEATVRRRLDMTAAVKGRKPADLDAMARVLAGLKGVTLTFQVTDKIEAEVRLDFTESAAALEPVLLPLVREALQAGGAEIDDMASWSARIDGTSGVLSGQLSEQSFRLALSPFFAAESSSYYAPATPQPSAGEDPKKAATHRYFTGLNELVNQIRTMRGLSTDGRIRWYHEYAHKINALPVLNVDEEALQLGTDISTTLRSMANAAANFTNWRVAVNQNRATAQVPTGYSTWGVAGGYNNVGMPVGVGFSAPVTAMVSNNTQINNLLAVNASTEIALRADTWKNINDAMAAMRRKMTQKYQVEFPAAVELPGK